MTKIKGKENKYTQAESSQVPEIASVRMNINITKSFHKKIKQKALDDDTTITDVVVKALKTYLNE